MDTPRRIWWARPRKLCALERPGGGGRSHRPERRESDIAVRMVRPTQEALLARKAGVIHLGFHAHPRYLKAHGTPKTLSELAQHSLIGFDREPSVQRFIKVGLPISRELFAFRCDSDIGQYAALRAGFGIGVCQVALGKRDQLTPILPGALDFRLETWVVMHKDLKAVRRMHLMFDHLAQHLQTYIASEPR